MKKYILSGIIILSFSQNSFSQKTWTLQECVDYALQHNIQIKQGEISTEISDNAQTQSLLGMFPSLNGSASHSYNFGRSVDPFSYEFTTRKVSSSNLSLNANVVLFNGFQLQNELKQSRLNYMSGKYDLDKIKNDVSLNVAAAYLQVLYAQEQLNAQNDRVDIAKKQKDRTKILTDAGTLPQGSFLDAEAQFATEELTKVNAENLLNNSYLSLIQLLELDSAGNFAVEKPKYAIPDQGSLSITPADIYSVSLTTQPEIKSAEYKLQSAEKGLAIARGARFPRLSMFGSLSTGYSNQSQRKKTLGGDYIDSYATDYFVPTIIDTFIVFAPLYSSPTYEDTPFSDQLEDNFNKAFGFNLSIPVFNGWATNTSVKRSKLNYENAKYSFELTKNSLFKSIQQAHADAIASLKKYHAAEKNVSALNEAFSYTEKKFTAGLLTSLDYTTARNNLTKAESDKLQAKYDLIFRLKVLDFYMGKPLVY